MLMVVKLFQSPVFGTVIDPVTLVPFISRWNVPPLPAFATLKLTPVTDGNRTFAEWTAEFDCPPEREKALAEQIGHGVFQTAFNHLKTLVRR